MSPVPPGKGGGEKPFGSGPRSAAREAERPGGPSAAASAQPPPASGTATDPSGHASVSPPAPTPALPVSGAGAIGREFKRRLRGGLLGALGFLLSPLSWWNDLFINVPLALGFAWLVALLWPAAFEAAFIAGYWLTNVLGLVLLTRGAKELLAGRPSPYSRRELLKDLLVAAAYTALIVLLVKLRVLQPLQDYGR